jgi:copper chaperone CopZ
MTMQGLAIFKSLPTALLTSVTLAASALNAAPVQSHATYEIIAEGMCCQGCAKKVAAKLYTAPGVINVKADVAKRSVTVTAKPSPKLTLEKLWTAVAQAKGDPSRLTTSDAIYTMTRLEQLQAEERASAGIYIVRVADMHDMKQAEKVAGQLKLIRGIESLSVDLAQGALLVKPAGNIQLSPWAITAAVGQAEQSALDITGPYGRFNIERVTQQAARTALSPR